MYSQRQPCLTESSVPRLKLKRRRAPRAVEDFGMALPMELKELKWGIVVPHQLALSQAFHEQFRNIVNIPNFPFLIFRAFGENPGFSCLTHHALKLLRVQLQAFVCIWMDVFAQAYGSLSELKYIIRTVAGVTVGPSSFRPLIHVQPYHGRSDTISHTDDRASG